MAEVSTYVAGELANYVTELLGGVVGQLARHVGRDLRLVPVGHQLAGDEGQHLRLVLGTGTSLEGRRWQAVIAAPVSELRVRFSLRA